MAGGSYGAYMAEQGLVQDLGQGTLESLPRVEHSGGFVTAGGAFSDAAGGDGNF